MSYRPDVVADANSEPATFGVHYSQILACCQCIRLLERLLSWDVNVEEVHLPQTRGQFEGDICADIGNLPCEFDGKRHS